MAVTKEKKQEVLNELNELFKSNAVYFTQNKGLSVKQSTSLRKKLLEQNIQYRVAKKTLMRLAAKNNSLPEIPAELLEGSVGTAFGNDDVIAPVKMLHEFAKEAEALEILGGLVEGRYISRSEAKSLATLPSREELLAKLLGSMKAPISGFYGVLHGVLRQFVAVTKAVQEKRVADGETAEAPAVEEKPAAEEAAPAEETEAPKEDEKKEEAAPAAPAEAAAEPAVEEKADSEEKKEDEAGAE